MNQLWVEQLPQMRGAGKNQRIIYSFMIDLYLRGQPICPSMTYMSKLCDSDLKATAQKAVNGLMKRDLIKIVRHGDYSKKVSNRYEINERYLPQEIRMKKEQERKSNAPLLKEYIEGVEIPEKVKTAILDWIELTQPTESVIQFKYKLNDLVAFCTTDGVIDWELFYKKVSRAIQGGWHNFIFKEEIEAKERERKEGSMIRPLRIQ